MKYFKAFANHSEYESYITGSSVAYPNVSVCEDEYEVHITDVGEIVDPDAPVDSKKPLTFEITSDGVITWTLQTGNGLVIEYSKNGGEWTSITSNTGASAPSISVVSGDTVQFRGDNATYGDFNGNMSSFSGSTCGFNVYGNIMSLINSTGFTTATTLSSACTFFSLFIYTKVVDASNLVLPATTLTQQCYGNMFGNCTGLTTAPSILPATTLAQGCYQYMFQGCSSLTSAPELPATTLAEACYSNMFSGCTSLTSAPELPATTLTNDCYSRMFYGCTSLTTAPELPATTLSQNCYYNMFWDCSSLNYIKCLATNISASSCTSNWVSGVASTGTFVKAAGMTSWETGPSGIPGDYAHNWTVEDAS